VKFYNTKFTENLSSRYRVFTLCRWTDNPILILAPCGFEPDLKGRSKKSEMKTSTRTISTVCRLGDVMLSVLATVPKVRMLKPGRGDGFLRAIKVRSRPFFGGEVKPLASCREIYGMLKNLVSMNKNTSQGQIYHSLCPFFLFATR
jgi:hypothetical protein